MGTPVKPKNFYQRLISGYVARRIKARKKYGPHSKAVKRLSKKIESWRIPLRRREKKEKKLHEIHELIKEYSGICVKSLGPQKFAKKHAYAKNLFYKYAIEKGIRGTHIAKFCGLKNPDGPTTQRLRFTRSFKTNRNNYEIWQRFKQYADGQKNV